jgi:hypothetical protein
MQLVIGKKAAVLAFAGFLVIAVYGAGTIAVGYSQTPTPDPVASFQVILNQVNGIALVVIGLAGATIALFVRLGILKQSQADKATTLLQQIQQSDYWHLDTQQKIVGTMQVLAQIPEAKKFMDDHGLDAAKFADEVTQTKSELDALYKTLYPQVQK